MSENKQDYSVIHPTKGIIAIKESEKEKSVLKTSGKIESNAYGTIVAINSESKYELGQVVVYNEYEGQEMEKYNKIKEEGIILIKEENILAIIK